MSMRNTLSPHMLVRSGGNEAARSAARAGLLTMAMLTASPAIAEQITHSVSADRTTETWIIREPNVRQAVTEHTDIRFQPGDAIHMAASGCVQTGGHGKTWKRYVNPSGPNSDRLYYGTIWIPGVIGERPPQVTRFKEANGHTVVVPATANVAQLYLRLGYIDDGYGDNGYDAHDPGTDNQCRDEQNAMVTLTVTHHGTGDGGFPPPPQPAPFDLLGDAYDDNLIPFNPMWGFQKLHSGLPPSAEQLCVATRDQFGNPVTYAPDKAPCTTQVTSRDDAFICGPHGNWDVATVAGPIVFESHSTGHFGDEDYSWYLAPPNGNGLTAPRNTLEPEFNSEETIDHFTTKWWNDFHMGVDEGGEAAKTMVNGKFAIVTGLFSLDFEHSIHAELHPVFAMAIRVKEDDPQDETWAIFVRLFGNEGFCSSDIHYLEYLPQNQFIFRLPLRWGASATLSNQVSDFVSQNGAAGPQISFVPGQGVLVTFDMSASPQTREVISGEVHLQWNNASPATVRAATADSTRMFPPTDHRRRPPVVASAYPADKEAGVESDYEAIIETLTPAQQAKLQALLPPKAQTAHAPVKAATPAGFAVLDRLPIRPRGMRKPTVVASPAPGIVARQKALIDALQQVTGMAPPPRH